MTDSSASRAAGRSELNSTSAYNTGSVSDGGLPGSTAVLFGASETTQTKRQRELALYLRNVFHAEQTTNDVICVTALLLLHLAFEPTSITRHNKRKQLHNN
eukprot:m.113942 g.113942  ORF g.113942 m.113942 type:complete len:101 (-) comp17108_c0_seq8:808-1110(-)